MRACPNLRLLRLDDDAALVGRSGSRARGISGKLRELAGQHGLAQLSMGMSHDLETAIEEGSTCVRVGTALIREAQKKGRDRDRRG